MQICIPIEFRPEGGGFYFLNNFSSYLGEIDWEITRDLKGKYHVLFTNHWMTPLSDIMLAIRRNPAVRIVQRIDGAAQNYGRDPEADVRQGQVNRLADLTIFQSEYARFSTRELFPVIGQDGPVIHNPVDLNIFTPEGDQQTLPGIDRVACVTWSTNPYKGRERIYEVAKRNPSVDFVLCGSFDDAPPLGNIHRLGLLDRASLAQVLRSCHVLLTFSRNEACPNHVLEALACGLPILYEESGAMCEVIGDCGFAVTEENFGEQFQKVKTNSRILASTARQRALKLFDPKQNFSKYVTEILKTLERPTHIPPALRGAWAWAYAARQKLGWA